MEYHSLITKLVKLQGIQSKIKQSGALDRPSSGVMKILAICGVLCQNVDFDAKRAENPDQMSTLDKITKVGIKLHENLDFLSHKDVLFRRALCHTSLIFYIGSLLITIWRNRCRFRKLLFKALDTCTQDTQCS